MLRALITAAGVAIGAGKPGDDGSLPSGREIANQYGLHERWGRLVKRSGRGGEFASGGEPDLHLVERQPTACVN